MSELESRDPPLRIGIMLDSKTVAAWENKIIEEIRNSDFLDLSLYIINAERKPRQSLFTRVRRHLPVILYLLYQRLDRYLFKQPRDAFEQVELFVPPHTIDTIRVVPIRRAFEHRFEQCDVEAVRSRNLDVILRFGFSIIRGEILDAAKYGIWSYHHGDNAEYRGGPPFFWEIQENNPVSGTLLQRLTEELDGGNVIYRSYASTDMNSLNRGRNAAHWKSAEFVLRRLTDLKRHGWGYITSLDLYNENIRYDKDLYKFPRNGTMIVFLVKLVWRLLANRHKLFFFYAQWRIAIRKTRPLNCEQFETDGFEMIASPRHHFFADPFLAKHDGATFVFFEDFDWKKRKGTIAVIRIDDNGNQSAARTVLERDYHLSYPCVFMFEDQFYMIPETSRNSTIELYRAVSFPHQWEFVRVILDDIEAADSTVHFDHGRLWLFTSLAVPGGTTTDELHIFFSDSPLGEFTPHPKNPVVSDVRSARCAGSLFRRGPDLIRPAQDCSLGYGSAINLNLVEELSESDYRERIVGRIEPDWIRHGRGTHTINRNDDHEVLDGWSLQPKCW